MEKDLTFKQTSERWTSYYSQVAGEINDEKFKEEFDRYTYTHTWNNSIRIIFENAGIKDGSKILDAGCGWGRLLLGVLEKFNGLNVTALDFQEAAIERGQKLIGNESRDNKIQWVQGDIQKLDFEDNHFDAIYSARVFQHLNNPEIGAKELFRILKPGGKLLIFVQNKICPFNMKYYSRLYSPNQVKHWFDGIDVVDMKVRSMDFYPSFLTSKNSQKFPLATESFLEKIPVLNQFGGKVLITVTKD